MKQLRINNNTVLKSIFRLALMIRDMIIIDGIMYAKIKPNTRIILTLLGSLVNFSVLYLNSKYICINPPETFNNIVVNPSILITFSLIMFSISSMIWTNLVFKIYADLVDL